MNGYIRLALLGLFLIITSITANACEVPVFRYALERWPTERYVLSCDTSNGLSPDLQSAMERLESPDSGSVRLTNLAVRYTADGAGSSLVCPLPDGRVIDIWSGNLTPQLAGRIADSPLRKEIASRLGSGQNAVWVLLKSGNQELDRAALETLESNIADAESSLSLPEAVVAIDGEGLPELRVDFSVVELSRDNPDEQIFTGTLVASEPDLRNYSSQPIAFPVFGRGRVLYALVGGGINSENIRDACTFLIGPCACEIKDLSPGMDLLMTADWSNLAGKSWVDRINGGPLTSLAAIVGFNRSSTGYGINDRRRSNVVMLGFIVALAVVLVVIAVVSIKIIKSSKSREQ